MKSLKKILAEFREYTEKVNSLEKIIENRKAKKKQLDEDKELFNEISSEYADRIYDWMRETDGMPYDFEDLFDGAMRVYFPLASEDGLKLSKIVRSLESAGWGVPADPKYDGSIKKFPVNKVKQKLQRLQADGGGEYEVEVDVADLRLVRFTDKVIPAGPRQGEKVTKKEETTMSKAVARLVKSGKLDQDMFNWWQKKQVLYTRDHNWRQIEKSFDGEDGSDYSVIVSRHPIDVLRMSDISNIRSCHSEGSEYFHCAIAEAKGHGPIAYLVKTEDIENHLMDKEDDLTVPAQIERAQNNLDRDEFREKMADQFDLQSEAGTWVFLDAWRRTERGGAWLHDFMNRAKMAARPEKHAETMTTAQARGLGVDKEHLRNYREWLFSAPSPRLDSDNLPDSISAEQWSSAVDYVYDKPEEKDSDLNPLSDFDNQELFRDRDRQVQGIGAMARVRLRKFEEPMRFGTFAVPEHRTYGRNVPGFVDSVTRWATAGQRDQFVGDEGELGYPRLEDLTRRGGSYGDNKDGSILNSFFRTMSGIDGGDYEDLYSNHLNADVDYADQEDEEENEMQRQWEEYERQTDELNDHANTVLEYAYASGMVDGDEQPYVHADGGVRYEITLGWEDMVIEDNSVYAADKDGNILNDDYSIPKSWGSDWGTRNSFEGSTTDPVSYYPEETEWEVTDLDNRGPVLTITHRIMCEDCSDPDDFDNFIDYMQNEVDGNYRENKEKIRRSLVESEWIASNDWDNIQDDVSEMEEELKNWSVFGIGDDDGEIYFSLRTGGSYPQGRNHMLTGIKWPYPSGSSMSTTSVLQGIFGGETKTFGLERYVSLTSGGPGTVLAKGGVLFKRAFRDLQNAANEYSRRQLQLNFGSEYEQSFDPIELSKNVEMGLTLSSGSDNFTDGNENDLQLGFHMRVRAFSEDSSDELQATFNFVKFIDSNIDFLKKSVVAAFSDEITAWEEQRRKDERNMSDGTTMARHAKRLRLQWDEAADNGNTVAEAIMILVMWTEQNFEKMERTAERWVATDILRLHLDGARGTIWDHTEDLPANWTEKVKGKMVTMGATFNQKESYNASYLSGNPAPEVYSQEGDDEPTLQGTLGEPRPAQEAKLKEEIYKRLQKKILKKKVKIHLTEKIQERKRVQKQKVRDLVKSKLSGHGTLNEEDLGYTQRTYKITFRIAMSKEHGGKREETENEMRAVPGVGTVKILPGTTRQDGSNYYADALVKFHLLGKRSVIQYIRLELLPGLRRIEGLSVMRMDRYEEITTMREWSDAYAGHGVSPNQSQQRAVPTPTIDAIAQDWMNMGRDGMGIHASSLAHSVAEVTMVSVDELMRYLGTNYFSATTKEFEDAKQRIINNGPPHPVQVAIGKNGRVKITAGDDLVMAAKDIGLKELPTTFSLQLQV